MKWNANIYSSMYLAQTFFQVLYLESEILSQQVDR